MKLLRRSLSATLGGDLVTVATVDSFQGQEYDVVVVSAVRGSAGGAGGAGFLADRPRLNVLLTRARMGLVIIGHAPTLARSPGWGRLLISLKERGLATGSGLEAVPLSERNSCSAEGYFGAKVPPLLCAQQSSEPPFSAPPDPTPFPSGPGAWLDFASLPQRRWRTPAPPPPPESFSWRALLESKDLTGSIFLCTDRTFDECIRRSLFGLPAAQATLVRTIFSRARSTLLFLYNTTARTLHGPFETAGAPGFPLAPKAWVPPQAEASGTLRVWTPFPAQLPVRRLGIAVPPLSWRSFASTMRFASIENTARGSRKFRQQLHAAQVLVSSKIQHVRVASLACVSACGVVGVRQCLWHRWHASVLVASLACVSACGAVGIRQCLWRRWHASVLVASLACVSACGVVGIRQCLWRHWHAPVRVVSLAYTRFLAHVLVTC